MRKIIHRTAVLIVALALVSCGGAPTSRLGQVRDADGGEVLVDADGYTLYTHTQDPPDVSHCTPACTIYWPPAEAAPDAQPDGGFTIITRDSGTRQWAYKGKPLYRFSLDLEPGQTGGDGAADGDWHVARP